MSRKFSANHMTIEAARYRLFGLVIESDLALGELHPSEGASPADVRIVRGADGPVDDAPGIRTAGEALVFTVPALARYTVTGGAHILVEQAPGASARNVRLFLLGSVFGILLHQRGALPLHANAIEIDGRAVAFCGASGAGKSTLAAWFHDRGHRILADDVCVIGLVAGAAMAQAGLPRLRLWRDALATGGRDAENYQRSFDDMDKYDVPTGDARGDALPLAAVYRLERSETSAISRLSGGAAIEMLIANTYRGEYLRATGGVQRHFADCVALARGVPAFAAGRVWGLDGFDAQATELEAHARAVIATARSSAACDPRAQSAGKRAAPTG